MNRWLTENARKHGILRGSGDVAWTKRYRLPFGIYVQVMRRRSDVFETIDPTTRKLVRCDRRGRILPARSAC